MSSWLIRGLQQDVFNPNEERLITCCHVRKFLKKKKRKYKFLQGLDLKTAKGWATTFLIGYRRVSHIPVIYSYLSVIKSPIKKTI